MGASAPPPVATGEATVPEPIHALGIALHHLIAGLAGGLVRAFLQPERHWAQTLVAGVVGALSAGYLTPLAVALSGLSSQPGAENAIAFCIGLSGMTLTETLLRVLAQRIK